MSATSVRWVAAIALFTTMLLPPASGGAQSGDSLYKRLGGYDAIAAVVDDFIGRMIADPSLKRFFEPFSIDSKGRIRQHLVDQVCNASGGPCLYTGRTMKVSHTGIGITEADWSAFIKHLTATLDKFKVPEREKNDVLAFVASVKRDIVEKPWRGKRDGRPPVSAWSAEEAPDTCEGHRDPEAQDPQDVGIGDGDHGEFLLGRLPAAVVVPTMRDSPVMRVLQSKKYDTPTTPLLELIPTFGLLV